MRGHVAELDGWLPDVSWQFELGDLANLVVAVVGAYLAWLAIKMGREQDAVSAKQMVIMEGQKGLLEELGKLERKQTDIAEKQERMLDAQRALRPLVISAQNAERYPDGRRVKIQVELLNLGSKPASSMHWNLKVPIEV